MQNPRHKRGFLFVMKDFEKMFSEEGIENAVTQDENLGPYGGEHFDSFTVRIDDPLTLATIALQHLAETGLGKFEGEFIISGRTLEAVENMGFYIPIVEEAVQPKQNGEALQEPPTSIADAMDSENGVVFDPGHAHRNGNDLL